MNARVLPKTSIQLPGTDASLDLSVLSSHIVMELAAGLSDAAAIRERYGITLEQWEHLSKLPTFRAMLGDAVRKVRGDQNAGARIQLKADIVLEDAIPAYDRMIHSENTPAAARIDAGKLLAQLAGRTNKEGAVAPAGGGFVLNINLAGGREKLVIDGRNLPIEADAE